MPKTSKFAHAAIMEALDNQLRDNDPPGTRETLDRLLREGHSMEEARRLIATILAAEIYGVLKEKRSYNEDLYIQRLKNLPELPLEE